MRGARERSGAGGTECRGTRGGSRGRGRHRLRGRRDIHDTGKRTRETLQMKTGETMGDGERKRSR